MITNERTRLRPAALRWSTTATARQGPNTRTETRKLTGMLLASAISSSVSGGTSGSGFHSARISSISRSDRLGLEGPCVTATREGGNHNQDVTTVRAYQQQLVDKGSPQSARCTSASFRHHPEPAPRDMRRQKLSARMIACLPPHVPSRVILHSATNT